MKKQLLKLTLLFGGVISTMTSFSQTRYIDDVFSDYTKAANVLYDSNRSMNILFGSGYPVPAMNNNPIVTANLRCDIYSPAGDTITKRPVVIIVHTGSYLPVLVNAQTTGNKEDSAIVEICRRFAKKGYIAVAMNYRLGWRATTRIQAVATQDLLQATYRGMQDVRNCIRFLRANASTYGIDTSKIIVGGQGTGGYIALAVGNVDKRDEIESNIKFLRDDLSPMVNMDTLGDWTGVGGLPYFNYSADANESANAHMIFNYGGAMGDSTWMQANSLPMVGIHVATDPFAPYMTGDVRVPNGPIAIPTASGAGVVIPMANNIGINNKINAATYTDAYTTRAMQASGGVKNLFPLYTVSPADGAPWEWWDRAGVQAATGNTAGNFYGYPMPANGRAADSTSFLINPLMSAEKGRAYIDTVVNFVAPRIAVQFDLVNLTGVKEIANVSKHLSVYPNPATTTLNIDFNSAAGTVNAYNVMDITGRILLNGNATGNNFAFDVNALNAGLYFVNITLKDGSVATKRVVIE